MPCMLAAGADCLRRDEAPAQLVDVAGRLVFGVAGPLLLTKDFRRAPLAAIDGRGIAAFGIGSTGRRPGLDDVLAHREARVQAPR
ncbi:MAG: hypothetical protein IT457_02690 [Planctomycetes bacterium]|nr:hypothetical protein [Planctomycetota bacterium]